MRILFLLLKAVTFLLLLGLAVKNDGVVAVNAYLGYAWQVPLVVVMLVMFIGGLFCGAVAFMGRIVALNRELARVRAALGVEANPVKVSRADTGTNAE